MWHTKLIWRDISLSFSPIRAWVGGGLRVVWQNIDLNQWQLMLALIKISQYRVCLWYWEPAYQPFQICISLHLYSVSLHFVFVCHYILYLCVIVFCICLSLYFVFVCLCILYFCVIDFCISGLGTGWSLYWLSGRSSQPRLDFLHKRLRPRRRPSITWCNLAEMIFVFLYSLFCISLFPLLYFCTFYLFVQQRFSQLITFLRLFAEAHNVWNLHRNFV